MTVQELASEAASWFERARRATGDTETGPREDGEQFTRCREGRPEWIAEMVQDVHGEMFPDDWKYACIWAALDAISESSDPDDYRAEFADDYVDVYTRQLMEWLESHSSRIGYCDEAAEEFGAISDDGIVKRMQLGQYAEAEEVYGLVLRAIEARLEDIEDES